MRVPPGPDTWAARLERASRRPVGEAGTVDHDPGKVEAADRLHAAALARSEVAEAMSPLERARQVWAARGQEGVPALAERVVVEGPGEDFRAAIAAADRETLAVMVDELALRVLALEGQEAALSRLLDLKVVCEAGRDLVPEYNRRMRSTPTHRRGEVLPEDLSATLEVVQARLLQIRDEIQTGSFLGRIRERAGAVSHAMFEAGHALVHRLRGDLAARDRSFFGAVWDKIKLVGRHLVPGPIMRALAAITQSATDLVRAVSDVERDKDDPEALVRRLAEGLAAARATLDPEADAVAVGLVGETTAGLTGVSGHELVYLRQPGQLRLNRVTGAGARIGVGGSLRAYTTNAYGSPEALAGSVGRSALEVGAAVANLAFARGHAGEGEGGRSFSTVFAVGLTVSLPFLDGQALNSFSERTLTTIDLTPEQIQRLEGELAKVSPRARRWTGFLGRLVGKGKAAA
jgi:hypothetical protein